MKLLKRVIAAFLCTALLISLVGASEDATGYELYKHIDFQTGVYTGGGANGGFYENGVRIGYTLSANQYPYSNMMLMQVNPGANSGILLQNQLPEFTLKDIGKTCKISVKILPYAVAAKGNVLTGYLGTVNATNTFAYPTDYTQGNLTVMETWANNEFSVLEHQFVVTEELLSNRSIVMYLNNSTSVSMLPYMLDDVKIYINNEINEAYKTKYVLHKKVDFTSGIYTGGGANGGFYENGERIGYTLSTNQFPYSDMMLMQVDSGNNSGILIKEMLPVLTVADKGRKCKISIKVLPYDATAKGSIITGYLGTSNVGNTFAYPTDYTEGKITVRETWDKYEFSVLEHEFEITEELINNRSVVMYFNNSATSTTLTYMIDDVEVYFENETSVAIYGSNGKYAAGYIADESLTEPYTLYLAEYDEAGRMCVLQQLDSESADNKYNVLKAECEESGHSLKAFAFLNNQFVPLMGYGEKTAEPNNAEVRRDVPKKSPLEPNSDIGLYFADYESTELSEDKLSGGTDVIPASSLTSYRYYSLSKGNGGKGSQSLYPSALAPETLRVTVTDTGTTSYAYNVQLLKSLSAGLYSKGDVCLVKIRFRVIDSQNPDGTGSVMLHLQNNTIDQIFAHTITTDDQYVTAYVPFVAPCDSSAKDKFTVKVAYGLQTVEIAELYIKNYKNLYTIEQMPSDLSRLEAIEECQDQGAQWRKDALERIERIRKGDFKVKVVDKNGTPVPNASIKSDMFEHEFEWGGAINVYAVNAGDTFYSRALAKYFNSAVLEGLMQWRSFEDESSRQKAHKAIEFAKASGMKNVRGHTLIWDSKNILPEYMATIRESGDKDVLDDVVNSHFFEQALEFYGEVDEWDVMNESLYNTYLRDVFGDSIMNDWFVWAKKYSHPETKLFYNEIGPAYAVLDKLEANGVIYDGIGLQCHRTFKKASTFYDELTKLAKYGKSIKITEYDLAEPDQILRGESTRDFLITCFSHEAVDGFYIWAMFDGFHSGRGVILGEDHNLNYSGKQFVDLVYDEWWTNDAGTSGSDGSYTFRGFYGDYDVTVSFGNTETTSEVSFCKGEENEVVITLPIEYK